MNVLILFLSDEKFFSFNRDYLALRRVTYYNDRQIWNMERGTLDDYTEGAVKLTATDRAILESYKGMCEGLSDYLGEGYEFVLHSLEDFDKSVIKIINGYYTGRKEGSPITDLALHMLEKLQAEGQPGHISYFSKNKKGEPMHSCTITITGEEGRIIGLLCINLYLNTPLHRFLGNFVEARPAQEFSHSTENFVDNPVDLITAAVTQVRDDVLADANITAQNRNKEIVSRLAARGIFKLKDSVVQCADLLGISKNTVYMHLRNGNG